MTIPFNRPFLTGRETDYIQQAHHRGYPPSGRGFTRECQAWLERHCNCRRAFLTHSGTAALEMAAMLSDVRAGDEIIMPSYTYVSTANAFVLRGGVPVFVDIRRDTLNIDEHKVEDAITSRTRAIVPVHYAGTACEMDTITAIARRHDLLVIEDAAQAIMCRYRDRPAGSFGQLSALSFHDTKNLHSSEGGALLVNDVRFLDRAEIIREKGTNRSQFINGQVDKYTWVDIGSSYVPSDLIAAFLLAQMEEADAILRRRMAIWNAYHNAFGPLEEKGLIIRPFIPPGVAHNAHMYYLLLPDRKRRDRFIENLGSKGIQAVFHYVPLHDSPAGKRYCRMHGDLRVTVEISERLVRLPLWIGVEEHLEYIINSVIAEAG